MNITFLIGNGFDLGLGLKTSYKDFYEVYGVEDDTDKDDIKEFKKLFSEKNKNDKLINWADFERAFGEHSEDFNLENKQLYIDRFEDFVCSFNKYLEDLCESVDYSQADTISKKMNSALIKFFDIRKEDKIAIQKKYDRNLSKKIFNFISFNYTNTIDKCVSVLRATIKNDISRGVGSVVHVHGYIDKNMIMGVNDATQIKNKDFSEDEDILKEIVKPIQNSISRTNYDAETKTIIESSDIICIYGMSLGPTDAKWWACIADWLYKDVNRVLVILKHEEEYDERFPFTQRKCIESVMETFLEYYKKPEEIKKKIESRIYIGINNDIFSMKLNNIDKDI